MNTLSGSSASLTRLPLFGRVLSKHGVDIPEMLDCSSASWASFNFCADTCCDRWMHHKPKTPTITPALKANSITKWMNSMKSTLHCTWTRKTFQSHDGSNSNLTWKSLAVKCWTCLNSRYNLNQPNISTICLAQHPCNKMQQCPHSKSWTHILWDKASFEVECNSFLTCPKRVTFMSIPAYLPQLLSPRDCWTHVASKHTGCLCCKSKPF